MRLSTTTNVGVWSAIAARMLREIDSFWIWFGFFQKRKISQPQNISNKEQIFEQILSGRKDAGQLFPKRI